MLKYLGSIAPQGEMEKETSQAMPLDFGIAFVL
jgi:hypothetical protein